MSFLILSKKIAKNNDIGQKVEKNDEKKKDKELS